MAQPFYKTADGQSGLFFTAFGAFVAWQASTYPIGTAARMGPGYFPLVLGLLLVGVGVVVTLRSMRVAAESLPPFEWRAALAITGAILLSGALLLTAGLLVAMPTLVIVSALAARERDWPRILATAAATTLFAYLLFIVGLGLRIPLIGG